VLGPRLTAGLAAELPPRLDADSECCAQHRGHGHVRLRFTQYSCCMLTMLKAVARATF